MKTNRKDFEAALRLAKRVADPRPTMPILSHALLRAEEGRMTLTATDLTVTVAVDLPCEGDLPALAIPVADVARGLGARAKGKAGAAELVELGHDPEKGGALLHAAVGGVSRWAGLRAVDFPKIPAPLACAPVAYAPAQLASDLEYLIAAASADETRPHLNGIFFQEGRAAATDGHRLHVVEDLPAVGDDAGVIVPLPAAELLAATLALPGAESCEARIAGGSAEWRVRAGDLAIRIATKLADAQYPPIDRVIPKDRYGDSHTTVEAQALGDLAREAAKAIGRARNHGIAVSGNGTLSARWEDVDSGREWAREIPGVTQGAEWKLGFCAPYLADLADGFAGDITMEVAGSLDPVAVRQGARIGVIMPMRI